MSLASIQKEIFQLNSNERAMLIDLLWESLDEARIKEISSTPHCKNWCTNSTRTLTSGSLFTLQQENVE
jgi:hypothetical protein